ncbi:MAG: hypothetical protein M1834_001631 [Cirrosporium novae-zelandiae]|nr:MAG: hypothetical protein M1834_004148 [Cirrosporium novae-zelandiae]KAI9735615.1 MAG: hypothetical protein M1834_001631 [Cirrosporium novae-zelandiae]
MPHRPECPREAFVERWLQETEERPRDHRQNRIEPSRGSRLSHHGHKRAHEDDAISNKPTHKSKWRKRDCDLDCSSPRCDRDDVSKRLGPETFPLPKQLGLHAPFHNIVDKAISNRRRPEYCSSSTESSIILPLSPIHEKCTRERGRKSRHKSALRPSAVPEDNRAEDCSRSQTSSNASSTESERPARTYERRKRHKTNIDRYEPKVKGQGRQKRSSKRKKRKSSKAFFHSYEAPNVAAERLTLHPVNGLGIFKRGRASSPRRRGLPDLAFSEMKFLERRGERPELPIQDQIKKKKTRKSKGHDEDEEISRFFIGTRSPLLEKDPNAGVETHQKARSRVSKLVETPSDIRTKSHQPLSIPGDLQKTESRALLPQMEDPTLNNTKRASNISSLGKRIPSDRQSISRRSGKSTAYFIWPASDACSRATQPLDITVWRADLRPPSRADMGDHPPGNNDQMDSNFWQPQPQKKQDIMEHSLAEPSIFTARQIPKPRHGYVEPAFVQNEGRYRELPSFNLHPALESIEKSPGIFGRYSHITPMQEDSRISAKNFSNTGCTVQTNPEKQLQPSVYSLQAISEIPQIRRNTHFSAGHVLLGKSSGSHVLQSHGSLQPIDGKWGQQNPVTATRPPLQARFDRILTPYTLLGSSMSKIASPCKDQQSVETRSADYPLDYLQGLDFAPSSAGRNICDFVGNDFTFRASRDDATDCLAQADENQSSTSLKNVQQELSAVSYGLEHDHGLNDTQSNPPNLVGAFMAYSPLDAGPKETLCGFKKQRGIAGNETSLENAFCQFTGTDYDEDDPSAFAGPGVIIPDPRDEINCVENLARCRFPALNGDNIYDSAASCGGCLLPIDYPSAVSGDNTMHQGRTIPKSSDMPFSGFWRPNRLY